MIYIAPTSGKNQGKYTQLDVIAYTKICTQILWQFSTCILTLNYNPNSTWLDMTRHAM